MSRQRSSNWPGSRSEANGRGRCFLSGGIMRQGHHTARAQIPVHSKNCAGITFVNTGHCSGWDSVESLRSCHRTTKPVERAEIRESLQEYCALDTVTQETAVSLSVCVCTVFGVEPAGKFVREGPPTPRSSLGRGSQESLLAREALPTFSAGSVAQWLPVLPAIARSSMQKSTNRKTRVAKTKSALND